MTITIHVSDRDPVGKVTAGIETDRLLKRAVALAQQHAYPAGIGPIGRTVIATLAEVGDDQIQVAIAVYVRDRDRVGVPATGAVADGRLEGPVAVAQQYGHYTRTRGKVTGVGALALARHDQI